MDAAAFREWLDAGPLAADGAMGTSLVDRGFPLEACFEALNTESPEAVEAVHRGFVEAGAKAIWTNTFGGNRFKLSRCGLGERVVELNRAGVEVARRAGGDGGTLVAGSVGPLGVWLTPYGRVPPKQAFDAYAEQIAALAGAGADFIAIETQTDPAEMEQALTAAREVCDLGVLVTATFTQDDRTLLGSPPEAVAERLAELGADAAGVNCGQGPAQALRIVRAMRPHLGATPLVARPNAGGPQRVGRRLLYPATPDYFAHLARELLEEGVRLIGGCCGTGPEHTRATAAVIAEGPRAVRVEAGRPREREVTGGVEATPSDLARKLADGRFVIAVELEPPRGHAVARLVAAAETLAEAGADVIDVADSPMAKMRMSPWAACRVLQEQARVETVLHFPTRGRNLLRIQGDLLAVHALGVRNLFVCMGDPVTVGDYPQGSDTIDVTPTGLMGLVTESFNSGVDRSGASIGEPTSFLVGCALAPTAPDLDREARLLKRKIEAGARFALTQPVYSPDALERFRTAYEARYGTLELPLVAGVLPLISARHAEFIANEVPGTDVPEAVLDRMRSAGDRAEAEGLAMAKDAVAGIREHAQGIYVMPQFGRFDLAAEVVESV